MKKLIRFPLLSLAILLSGTAFGQIPDLANYDAVAKRSMESACNTDRVVNGPAAYAICLKRQIDQYSKGAEIPDLTNYDVVAKRSMESACNTDRVVNGPAAYAICLKRQIDQYSKGTGIPDLANYDVVAKRSMESTCNTDRVVNGPAAYAICLKRQIDQYSKGAGIPDLAKFDAVVKRSMESACNTDRVVNGPAAYAGCLRKQIEEYRKIAPPELSAKNEKSGSSQVNTQRDETISTQLESERQKLVEERRQLDAEKTLRDQEARQVAEDRRKLEAQKAQLEQEKKSSRIAIKGTVTQPDANGDFTITISTGADTASLKIDGDELGGKRDGNYVIKRVARVGEDNSYKITARDVFGNTDSATVTVSRQVADSRPAIPRLNPANVKVQRSRDAVAIIIGIENYRRVAKADFANADAKEFYTYASRALGIKPENIKLLVDDGADDIEMLNAFQNWLPLKVNKGKTDVYVFYSGHGYPSQDGKSLYFLPFNVDKQYLDRTSVKQKEIVAALQRAQAKSVTMFIDACYSGQTRNGEVLVAGIKPVFITTEERAYPPEFTVITASAADQFSSASQDLKHGIFSFYLMKALEGDADENNDGRLTSGELQRYLSDMVGRQAMGLNRTQSTQLFGNADRVLMTR